MKKVVKTLFPIQTMIYDNITKSQLISESVLGGGNMIKIQAELNRKRAEAEMNELNAKVSQELAIAERIRNAEVVEIEEYYENGGGGKATGTMTKESTVLELAGDSKKIVKRVYTFKGIRNDQPE